MSAEQTEHSATQLEENLKKALTEMLLLTLLSRKESYIAELTDAIHEKSNGNLSIVFPYGAIYRMEQAGHICEVGKRIAPDGRRRQYFGITAAGREYLNQQQAVYAAFTAGVARLLEEREENP